MTDTPPSFPHLFHAFARIGLLSFGGPAAQIAVMHRILVDEQKWLTEDQFLRALSFCMMLPGPEAMQLATYAGWRLRGTAGGLIAGLLFVLPGAVVIAILAAIYISYGTLPIFQTLFVGVKAAVVMIVAQALWRLSNKALKDRFSIVLAVLAFAGLYLFQVPFPVIIACAALLGVLRAVAPAPDLLAEAPPGVPLRSIAIWGGLWVAPLVLLWGLGEDFLLNLSLFFGKLALVTFGGAYAVLAYMTQEVVQAHGWITTEQMIDALGLAETTPGPLILVTQFVGHLAGSEEMGRAGFAVAGLLTLWMTFTPCFLWIFAGAPYLEHITSRPRINAALSAVTAAVVGVIANLSLWFALNVIFAATRTVTWGPVDIVLPLMSTFSPTAFVLSGVCAVLIFALRASIPLTLAISAAVALLLGSAIG
ncbi:chromate efflux transporter [Primorskyibacter aestuariivivens]|uniref:chromate efflux transporter n=1 Tax=Primorskyibacter aestuariivivens TaxID=1888912 RepID=UPI0023008767|nr:chromate efflux transporter [Primorskyibacter aestuariivivens]MDA7430130.1 chromate efflux transporter [Primorskyibacter aestuariivivens]